MPRQTLTLTLVLALALVVRGAAVAEGAHNDCRCSCCVPGVEGGCPDLTHYDFYAGSPGACIPGACRSKFYACPDFGAHNDDETVLASYTDCACTCSRFESVTPQVYSFFAGSSDRCSEAMCAATFHNCPDTGSHSEGLTLEAEFIGVDLPAEPTDCDCECCTADQCAKGEKVIRSMWAGGEDMCTPERCMATHRVCPDSGGHNDGAEVVATYTGEPPHDCECECCKNEVCPDTVLKTMWVGDKERCTDASCSSHHYACPDAGSHSIGGMVQASWVGDESAAKLSKEEVQALIGIFTMLALCVAGGGIYHVYKRVMGYKWIKLELDDISKIEMSEASIEVQRKLPTASIKVQDKKLPTVSDVQ